MVGTWRPATHPDVKREMSFVSRRWIATHDQGAADRCCIQVADD